MEQKTFIEASNANNIHVEKKCFLQLLNLKVCESLIFSDRATRGAVYFCLHKSSLHFYNIGYQIFLFMESQCSFPYKDI